MSNGIEIDLSALEIDFSELYKHSGGLVRWSPDGRYLAVATGTQLVLRHVRDCSIAQIYACADEVEHVSWSFDSQYVLCACYQRATVDVWSVDRPDWTCRITEGAAGMASARWGPDGRHVLTVAAFQLHLTVWSLLDGSAIKLDGPKHAGPEQGISFSPENDLMAVAHRRSCKDLVTVYSTATWEPQASFEPETRDLADLTWSPTGHVLAISDCALDYRICFHAVDGRHVSTYVAYENALGVINMKWSPSGRFLAVSSYDESVRIISTSTWRPVVEYVHAHTIAAQTNVHVYREVIVRDDALRAADAGAGPGPFTASSSLSDTTQETEYQIETHSLRLEEATSSSSCQISSSGSISSGRGVGGNQMGLPRLGCSIVAWSADEKFLATRNDMTPHAVWIWETRRLGLCSVLVHRQPVRSLKWHPHASKQLAICTGTAKVHLWSVEGASWFDVPARNFAIRGLRWNPTGCALVLLQAKRLCQCFIGDHPGSGGDEEGAEGQQATEGRREVEA